MKKFLLACFVLANFYTNAQITWIHDFNMARSVAIADHKFIVMDFWAEWCGPCKDMDKKMWDNDIINDVSDNFIALKINVDANRDFAMKYEATSIPKVIIIDPAGNVVWQQVGFSSASPFLAIFEQIPRSILSENDLVKEFYHKGNEKTWMSLASGYQAMGRENNYLKLKLGFLSLSDKYLKKIKKKSSDNSLMVDASLNLILNDAYRGKTKKALKQMLKDNNSSSELRNFVLAYCYMCTDQDEAMKKYKAMISNPDYLAQLN